ncbi:MAG: hypothetical protein K2N48_13030 [Muribaculaceae bacterium]|nr:hypothetical protein [Muribaculaceae bacterium]
MRYDDERYFDEEEDKDFWDDELELTSGDTDTDPGDLSNPTYEPSGIYHPYEADGEDQPQDNGYNKEPEDYYSDPEPEEAPKPRRERIFGKKDPEEQEEEENDYFDSDPDTEPSPPKKTKLPKLDPEDPDYWVSDEESPLEGIIHGTSQKWKWQLGAALAILVLITGAWIWFFRPYADNAVKYGYIKDMERRGSIIKTFEGSMIPYKELGDPDPLYFKELRFSVQSDSLAAVMKRMMLGCVPVRVEYEMYHAPLPWKGEEKMIVIKADTADPRKILPPEYRLNDK